MKRFVTVICIFCFCSYLIADIIPVGQKSVPYCVKIQNADSFPNVVFILVVKPISSPSLDIDEIKSTDCLSKGYKFNSSKIFAMSKSYIEEKELSEIDFSNDKNALLTNISVPDLTFQYVPYDTQVKDILEYYRVLGFTDSSTVIYLSKRVTSYEDDYKDSILFPAPVEFDNLKQYIENFAELKKIEKTTQQLLIYPSPSQELLNLFIVNERLGPVLIELFDMAGHKLSNFSFIKTHEELKKTMNIKYLRSGIYNLRYTLGDHVENRLFLKK